MDRISEAIFLSFKSRCDEAAALDAARYEQPRAAIDGFQAFPVNVSRDGSKGVKRLRTISDEVLRRQLAILLQPTAWLTSLSYLEASARFDLHTRKILRHVDQLRKYVKLSHESFITAPAPPV